MSHPEAQTCDTCVYANRDGAILACHRWVPPWPEVLEGDWCGEWSQTWRYR